MRGKNKILQSFLLYHVVKECYWKKWLNLDQWVCEKLFLTIMILILFNHQDNQWEHLSHLNHFLDHLCMIIFSIKNKVQRAWIFTIYLVVEIKMLIEKVHSVPLNSKHLKLFNKIITFILRILHVRVIP